MKTNPNDAAFARPFSEDKFHGGECKTQDGLTKLEYFSAMTLQGILSNSRDHEQSSDQQMVNYAVHIAKTLIDELNKKGEDEV